MPDAVRADRCPVGDFVNVSVFDFIVRELKESAPGADRAAAAARIKAEQDAARQPDTKPLRACIVESQFSHVLSQLCAGAPGCLGIGVYDRSGLAIGLTSRGNLVPTYGFADEARWKALTRFEARESGADLDLPCAEAIDAGLECGGPHRLVAFSVFSDRALLGVATCIVATETRAGGTSAGR